MIADDLIRIRDESCPICGEGPKCPILLNLLNDDRKAGSDEREKFFEGNECRYFKRCE